jgi:hypothetical protein
MNAKDLPNQLKAIPDKLLQYSKLVFVALVLLAYIFIVLRVGTLSNASPNQEEISKDTSTSVQQPQISQATVNKITQLQNNSVSAQALFNQARQDPFQE